MREFELTTKDANGNSLKDEAESLLRQRGYIPPEYESLPFPNLVGHIWGWFIELTRTRGSNGFGANAINYTEIDSWARLTRRKPTALEIYALTQLDAAYLAEQSKQSQSKGKK